MQLQKREKSLRVSTGDAKNGNVGSKSNQVQTASGTTRKVHPGFDIQQAYHI